MTEPDRIAAIYLDTWNEPDGDRRRDLVEQAWAQGATYVDPLMAATGRDQISSMIGQAQASFPGFRFRVCGTPDGYGQRVRFSWTLGPDDAPAMYQGTDVVRLTEEGKIAEVIGFLDRVPA